MRFKIATMIKIMAVTQLAFLVSGCVPLDDIAFSRRVLTALVQGRYAARNMIDWDNFKAIGQDVSAPYKAIKKDKARIDYQRAFINGFAKGFQEQKADVKAFYNWRYYKTTASKISIVVANCRTENVLFLFYVKSTLWGKKLVGINALIGNQPVRDIPQAFEDPNYYPPVAEARKQALEQQVVEQNLAADRAQKIQEQQQAGQGEETAPEQAAAGNEESSDNGESQ